MDLIERNVIKKKKKIFPSSSPNYKLFVSISTFDMYDNIITHF